MEVHVKQELVDSLAQRNLTQNAVPRAPVSVIDLSSSDSDSDHTGEESKRVRVFDAIDGSGSFKKPRMDELGFMTAENALGQRRTKGSKQFWKAGDYEGSPTGDWERISGGMDHVRVHPKFLHSNATSHKWALGAFAELLDNSLDEVCNGATFVTIDMHENKKDGSKMITIEDNGGGMDPEKMRQCMSLGYSAKSKIANTIGQYGNGFKTSTMRLGADVIVFSRCSGKDGKSPSQSIGLLSYTFLRSTGKEDIVVPMLDYERQERGWAKLVRYSVDWNKNVETIVQWSPFSSEADLLRQFNLMKDHGTRIVIYNLWEDDQGLLELDFDADPYDIQLRGVNREEKNIQMANQYPNSRHFLTYRHSLRSYASILYLRLPPSFRIILRGKDVEHHNIVNDMMLSQEKSYRPQTVPDGAEKDVNMTAVVTIGFVKDAKHHIDVQGFNVYHKNRLIKPFWRLWNATGSDGRGVIGVLEANFVEPAHDKQGFERTTVLARLEAKLVQMQKTYWSTLCHKIGYAPRRNKKLINGSADRESSPDYLLQKSSQSKSNCNASSTKTSLPGSEKFFSRPNQKQGMDNGVQHQQRTPTKSGKRPITLDGSSSAEDVSDNEIAQPRRRAKGSSHKTIPAKESFGKDSLHRNWSSSYVEETEPPQDCATGARGNAAEQRSQFKGNDINADGCPPSDTDLRTLEKLKEENLELKERFNKREGGEVLSQLLQDLQYERDRSKSLESQLEELLRTIDDLNREQESLIDIFSEERERRDGEEENLRKKLKDASNTIQELQEKARLLGR